MMILTKYLNLCKLKVVALMLLCSTVGMILATPNIPNIELMLWGNLGIGLASASGAAINHVIDRKIDKKMARTNSRPLPTYQLSTLQAISFAIIIGTLGLLALFAKVNSTAALLTMSALFGYGLIYTALLKRITPQNIVIGGLSGALPPLLGWVCINPNLSAEPWLLVLIIFVWTPPHFWALAIAKIDEYKQTKLPMLPITHGVEYTKIQIALYASLLIAATALPYAINMFGWIYLLGSQLLNFRFCQLCYRLYLHQDTKLAMQVFIFSIYYLMLLFIIMLFDHYYV